MVLVSASVLNRLVSSNTPHPSRRVPRRATFSHKGRRKGAFCSLASILAATLAFLPTPALAHASDRGHVLLLPTGHYLAGGALAVAASFAVLLLVPPATLGGFARRRLALGALPLAWRELTGWLGTLFLLLLVAAGVAGSRDPLANLLPLTVWTVLWVGMTLVQGVVGDLWSWIEPWRGPCRLAERLGWRPRGRVPGAAGFLPAVPLLLLFTWFELVDPAPDDPARLAAAVAAYGLFTLAAMLVFGHDAWRGRGEFLSVLFGFLARLAPVESREEEGRVRFALRWPGSGLASAAPLSPAGTLFLLGALAGVSFDGLSRTFLYLGAVGANPLEHPGRTAMAGVNTMGLLAAWAAMAALFHGAVALGRLLAAGGGGKGPEQGQAAGLLVWSLAPIALAYHFAHYLVALAVNGQYWLKALSDPLWRGWDLFGTADMPVRAAIAAGSDAAWVVWNLQAGGIVGGHVLAVLVAHGLAGRLFPERRRAALFLSPLTLLMVGYTLFGLWLLSTPTGT